MAMTSVRLRTGEVDEVSLDMWMVSRTEYVIREYPRADGELGAPTGTRVGGNEPGRNGLGRKQTWAGASADDRERGSSHAGVFGANFAQAAALAGGALGDDPALERSAVCALADC